jgi:hypothetical protein
MLDLLRDIYRRAYWLPTDFRELRGAGWPDHLIYFGGTAFGDDLLLGSVLHELHARRVGRLAVISRLTELFDHYPFPLAVLDETHWPALGAMLRWGRRATKPEYICGLTPPDIEIPGNGHIIAEMARNAGMRGPVRLRTWLYLTEAERERGGRIPNQAAIQCTSKTSVNACANKLWPVDRYQRVVDENRDRLAFVQIGSLGDPPLRGALDLRGQTTLRESAAILSQSRVFVGYVGFLMHLARAVECRSVIVFGGREHPSQSGYVANENLFTALPCSPCWRLFTCVADHQCMEAIRASDVTNAITRALARTGPLETALESIP